MAGWEPTADSTGRTWIGIARNQELGNILGAVVAGLLAGVIAGLLASDDATGILARCLGFAVGGAIALLVVRPSVSHMNSLFVTEASLEVRRGVRTNVVPWDLIEGFTVEHRAWRGGDVVVLRGPSPMILPAPHTARRFLPRLFADADFDAKLAYLRSHVPVAV